MSKLYFTVMNEQRYPSDVYKYMKSNANPRMSIKLMQISKYFQFKTFPYNVMKDLQMRGDHSIYYETINDIEKEDKFESLPENLWIIGDLRLIWTSKNIISTLSKKVIAWEVKELEFDKIRIKFADFKILTASGSVEELYMKMSIIVYGGNRLVELENIFECLPNLKTFIIDSPYDWEYCADYEIPSITSAEKANSAVSSTLRYLSFTDLMNGFNLEKFFDFIKEHPEIQLDLSFERNYHFDVRKIVRARVDAINRKWSKKKLSTRLVFEQERLTSIGQI